MKQRHFVDLQIDARGHLVPHAANEASDDNIKNRPLYVISHSRYRNLCWACIKLVFGIILVFVVFSHKGRITTLSNGTVVQITPAWTCATLCSKASCKVVCRTKSGNIGTISFLQDSDSCPAMVMPAADGQCLLFLYDADVHYRLMRIDPNRQSVPFPSDSYLNYVVLSSSWKIEEGTSNDWEEAYSYLKTVPQSVFDQEVVGTWDLVFVRLHYQKEELLSEVKREIRNSQHGWVY